MLRRATTARPTTTATVRSWPVWRGKAASRLGLSGEVAKAAWDALCDNRDPSTGAALTPRQKENRRVGYDFNFHAPKSVSLLYALTGDERLLSALRGSVHETMQDIEAEMQTRVRSDGRNEDRTTGNMVWGEFIHTTARPVGDIPDPHLHAHCFVFNVTWDSEEERWKAGQFAPLKRDAPYFEAMFHARLAQRLESIGIPTERTKRGWELQGLAPATLRSFSRRTALIEAKAKEAGVFDPAKKGELGAKTLERKQKQLSSDELRELWRARLTVTEQEQIARVAARLGTSPALRDECSYAADAVSMALDHCLERSSVVSERRIIAEAMMRAVGSASPDAIAEELRLRQLPANNASSRRTRSWPKSSECCLCARGTRALRSARRNAARVRARLAQRRSAYVRSARKP